MKFLGFAVVVLGCTSLALANSCEKACTYEYNPICGSDGQTYSNPCGFEIGQCNNPALQKAYSGQCECPQACTLQYDPVCGSDGVSYPTLCNLKAAICADDGNTLIQADGPC